MSTTKPKPPRLGKGLSSLMGQPVRVFPPSTPPAAAPSPALAPPPAGDPLPASTPVPQSAAASPPLDPNLLIHHLPLAALAPNPHQPRQTFTPTSLEELAQSIRSEGILQPIIVRPQNTPHHSPQNDPHQTPQENTTSQSKSITYEIIAGERRWRAAQLAKLEHIPCIIRDLDDKSAAEWALVENLQREDLNPIERAHAFARLIEHHHLTHEQIGQRLGLDRSSISNHLRLLALHPDLHPMLATGDLSLGQAKVLAGLSDPTQQLALAQRAHHHQWSVRQLEHALRLAQGLSPSQPTTPDPADHSRQLRSAHFADLEKQLAEQLATKVHIRPSRRKGAGTLSIEFYSVQQFDTLLQRLGVTLE